MLERASSARFSVFRASTPVWPANNFRGRVDASNTNARAKDARASKREGLSGLTASPFRATTGQVCLSTFVHQLNPMLRSLHILLLVSAIAALPAVGQTPVFLGTIGLHADEFWGSVEITGATTDTNGDSYIVGGFRGTVTFGTTTIQKLPYGSDVFVAKLGADGIWGWVSHISGTMYGSGYGAGIALDGTGGLYFSASLLPDSLS